MSKKLIGTDIGGYTFDASAQTVTLTGLPSNLELEQVLLITNVTSNQIIYQFEDSSLGGTISANVITLTFDSTSMSDTDRLQIFVEITGEESPNIFIMQGIAGNQADINSSNELKVVQAPPSPPPGTVAVEIIGETPLEVAGNGNEYEYYTIPSGETLILQRLYNSFEGNSAQSKVEVYDDPLGVNAAGDTIPATWVRIIISHIEFNIETIPLSDVISYLGDGTRRIALRRKRLDGGARELYAKASGYY